jgi:hypothetical protein
MNEFIFFVFLIFILLPFIKKAIKSSTNLSANNKRRPAKANWGQTHGQIKAQLHKQLHKNDASNVFPEEHQANVRERDQRDRQEYRKMEKVIHGRNNKAMTKVGNKSRTDWGTRGESGATSSKMIMTVILLVLLAHFIIAGFFPELIPGNS